MQVMIRSMFSPFPAGLAAMVLAIAAFVLPANAAELLMFTRDGCPYCVNWEREIEPIYPKTSEGEKAPLRKVRTDRSMPEDMQRYRGVRFTPTFILVENGTEIGRFAGYGDDATFWAQLGMLMRRLDDRTPDQPKSPETPVIKTTYEPNP